MGYEDVLTERIETLRAEMGTRRAEINTLEAEIRVVTDRQIAHEIAITGPDGLRAQIGRLRDDLEKANGQIAAKLDDAVSSNNRIAWALVAAALAFAVDVGRGIVTHMKLAAIAGVLLVLTAVSWVGSEIRRDSNLDSRCVALEETVDGLNHALEFIAQIVARAPCCTPKDAAELRARKVRKPRC